LFVEYFKLGGSDYVYRKMVLKVALLKYNNGKLKKIILVNNKGKYFELRNKL